MAEEFKVGLDKNLVNIEVTKTQCSTRPDPATTDTGAGGGGRCLGGGRRADEEEEEEEGVLPNSGRRKFPG